MISNAIAENDHCLGYAVKPHVSAYWRVSKDKDTGKDTIVFGFFGGGVLGDCVLMELCE